MTAPTGGPSFDPRPLTAPIDRRAAREYARRVRASIGTSVQQVLAVVVLSVVILMFGGGLLTAAGGILTAAITSMASGAPFGVLFGLVPLAFAVVIIGVLVTVLVKVIRSHSGDKWYRLDWFARSNGMTFMPRLNSPALPGMIFGLGRDRHALDLVRGQSPRFVEFANYRYTTGSGRSSTTHRWGYVAVKLDTPLPHIVLDALSNNGLFGSNLPLRFTRDQRLGLEGDFDKHFALYCPQGYERDALYLFTPDIMARFIDNAAALDVEIVDDWLFLYARRDFSTLDPATWAWLFSVVGALLDKFEQWARWRDERLRHETAARAAATTQGAPGSGVAGNPAAAGHDSVPFVTPLESLRPPPGVAQQGRRLRKGVPWAAFIVIGVFVTVWLAMQSGVLGLLIGR